MALTGIKKFQMYTNGGNAAVAAMVEHIIEEMRSGQLRRVNLEARIRHYMSDVVKRGYPEVHDTEPEWAIADAINVECEAQGWKPVDRWEF